MIEFYDTAAVSFVTFCIDFQRFSFMDKIAEHFVEDVTEVAIADGGDGIFRIAYYVIVMAHDVEILKPGHFTIYGFQIGAVCFFPILVVVIASVVWVGLLDVMY